uniref:Uncharacterized protein n=1 Tax=viral metagenome TaxID=1070528 RepID=A0A6M3IP61_9ZZZZ
MTTETNKNGIVESLDGLAKGGYQGIKTIRGILTSMKQVGSKFTENEYGPPKDQIEVDLTDAVIIEMFEGSDEIELKDGHFKFWIPYAAKGKAPQEGSIYARTWLSSALAMGKKPSEFLGEYVTLTKKKVDLFKTDKGDDKKPLGLNPDGSKIMRVVTTEKYFSFVKDTEDSGDYTAHIKELMLGKSEKVAARAVLLDNRTQQHPEYKEAIKNGTIGTLVGLKLVEDLYVEA